MKTTLTLITAGLLTLSGCKNTEAERMETKSNRQKAMEVLNSIESGDPAPVAYINPGKYIQHNLAVGDGLAGFGAVMAALPERSAKVNVVRAFEDGDYVFTHTKYNFFGPKPGSIFSGLKTD